MVNYSGIEEYEYYLEVVVGLKHSVEVDRCTVKFRRAGILWEGEKKRRHIRRTVNLVEYVLEVLVVNIFKNFLEFWLKVINDSVIWIRSESILKDVV